MEVQVRLDGSICVVTWLWNMVARWLPFLPYCNVDTTSCLLQYFEKNSLGQMNSKASLVVFYLCVHSSAFCGSLLIHKKSGKVAFTAGVQTNCQKCDQNGVLLLHSVTHKRIS